VDLSPEKQWSLVFKCVYVDPGSVTASLNGESLKAPEDFTWSYLKRKRELRVNIIKVVAATDELSVKVDNYNTKPKKEVQVEVWVCYSRFAHSVFV